MNTLLEKILDYLYEQTRASSEKLPFAKTFVLTRNGWNSSTLQQTVSVTGVSADESSQIIQICPKTGSIEKYVENNILAIGQGQNSITFKCDTVPDADIEVYAVVQYVSALME